jgi:hypothetical protein
MVLAIAVAPALAACESTQDKAAKLRAAGVAAFTAKGLRIDEVSKDVKVGRTVVLQDRNGVAAAVELRNTSSKTLADVPVAIDVQSAKGKSLFKNDAPGLSPELVSMPVLRPNQTAWWVHDQVLITGGKPARGPPGCGSRLAPLPPRRASCPRST